MSKALYSVNIFELPEGCCTIKIKILNLILQILFSIIKRLLELYCLWKEDNKVFIWIYHLTTGEIWRQLIFLFFQFFFLFVSIFFICITDMIDMRQHIPNCLNRQSPCTSSFAVVGTSTGYYILLQLSDNSTRLSYLKKRIMPYISFSPSDNHSPGHIKVLDTYPAHEWINEPMR